MIYTLSNQSNIIKYIIHISDLHFTIKDRYVEYENVFTKFIEKIKTYPKNETVVVMTGDLFNEKNKLESKLISFAKKMIYEISKVHTTFMITGNHDLLSSNRNIPDSISSVFFNDCLDDFIFDITNNLYYLKNTGYYVFNNIGFGVLSIFDILDNTSSGFKSNLVFPDGDELDQYFKNQNVNQFTKLALLHTTVKDSLIQTNDGHSRYLDSYEDHISVEDIKNYDFILLGDVHKFQYIENACYPSSLVQQNFGEDVLDHGFVVLKRDPNVHQYFRDFIRVYSDYSYVKCFAKLSKKKKSVELVLPQYDDSTKNVYPKMLTVRLHISEEVLNQYVDTKHTKDDLIQECNKWFEERNFIIRNLEVIIDKVESNAPELQKQLTLDHSIDWTNIDTIKKYLKEVYPDQVESMLPELNHIYEVSMLEKSKSLQYHWKLKKMSWDNLLCYGENNHLDFTYQNLNMIIGNNYSGKSSVIDILLFCIYGTTSRIDKIVQIINNNKKTAYCSLIFEYGDEVLKLERFLKKKTSKSGETHGQKIYLRRLRGTSYEDVIVNSNAWTGEKLIETPLKIDDYTTTVFGNKYNFMSTYILNQNNQNSFVHMKNTERKELIESWLNLECLEEMRKTIKIKKKEYDDEYLKISSAIQQLKNVESNLNLKDNEMETIPVLEKTVVDLENQLQQFHASKKLEKPVSPKMMILKKEYTLQQSYDLLKSVINKLQTLKSSLKKNIVFDESEFLELVHQIRENEMQLNQCDQKIKEIEFDIPINVTQHPKPEKSVEQLNNEIKIKESQIDEQVIQYFKNSNNLIPASRQRNCYSKWLTEYQNFQTNDIPVLKMHLGEINVDNVYHHLLNLKKKFEWSKQCYLEKQKYKLELDLLNFDQSDLVTTDLDVLKQQQNTIWSNITKTKLKSMKMDKNDSVFCMQYYEYIETKIEKVLEEIQREERQYNDVKNSEPIEYYLEMLHQYKETEKESNMLHSSVKNLQKFTFDKQCQCCQRNSELLKYAKTMEKYNQLQTKLSEFCEKFGSIKGLENYILNLKMYLQFLNKKNSLLQEVENYKTEKQTYLLIKQWFEQYKILELDIKRVQKQNQYFEIKQKYDQISTDYVPDTDSLILDIENKVKQYLNYEKEFQSWQPYVERFDEYEKYESRYTEQCHLKSSLNKLYSDLQVLKKYEQLEDCWKRKAQVEKEKQQLLNTKKQYQKQKSEMEILKSEYMQQQSLKTELELLEKDYDEIQYCISQLELKNKQYDNELQLYNQWISDYHSQLQQSKIWEKTLVDTKVQLRTIQLKQEQYVKMESEISKKTAESYQVTQLVNVYKCLNDALSLNGYNYWIYKNVIPILNDYVNDILKNIVDFCCEIKLENESSKTAINLFIKNSNSDFYVPIKSASGFQNQILNIAFRLCLIRLNNSVGDVIFMDESFVSFDLHFQSKIPELLKYFNRYIERIFIISHHNDLDKSIQGKFQVEKRGLYSIISKV